MIFFRSYIKLLWSYVIQVAAWGIAANFFQCLLLVFTGRWHGVLTIDHSDGVQKIYTAPTSSVVSVPMANISLGL